MPRGAKPQTHCKRGHEFTPANTIWRKDRGTKRCRECFEAYRLLLRKRRNPSETGRCRKGLHPWIESNWYIDKNGYAHCRGCERIARHALAQKGRVICIVRSCKRATVRGYGGTYICPRHRKDPPAWIFKAGLRIVGTEVVAA